VSDYINLRAIKTRRREIAETRKYFDVCRYDYYPLNFCGIACELTPANLYLTLYLAAQGLIHLVRSHSIPFVHDDYQVPMGVTSSLFILFIL